MADDLIDFAENPEEPVDAESSISEIYDYPQTLVTERIIFVIDMLLFEKEINDEAYIHTILTLCKSYFDLKKKICIKPPKFECLLYNNKTVLHTHIESARELQAAFIKIKNVECEEETQPLKIDKVFDKIATLVELPDPECLKNHLPPNWVYHVVWLFGRDLHVPTMENTNSFDYLMMTPYFALDILYVYDKSLESNQCEQIAQALQGLNENQKGYFLTASVSVKAKVISSFAQFLGHPLIRVPQQKATFNILELGNRIEINKNNSDDEQKFNISS